MCAVTHRARLVLRNGYGALVQSCPQAGTAILALEWGICGTGLRGVWTTYLGPVAPLGVPAGVRCPVLRAALGLVTANVNKVRLGGRSSYHLCFPAGSTDLKNVGLDPQALFQA